MRISIRSVLFIAGLVLVGFLPIVLATVYVLQPSTWVWGLGAASLAMGALVLASLALTHRRQDRT